MNISPIAVRYAKSIFQLAVEKNVLDTIYSDFEHLSAICAESPEFIALLESPIMKPSAKTGTIRVLFKKENHEYTTSLINLLITNKRERFLPDIVRNFLDMYRHHKGIKKALLISSTEVSPEMHKQVKAMLTKSLNATIDLATRVDASLIGGFVLRVEEKQIDASVAHQLAKVRRELLESAQ